ncbi:MAG TPA: tetratricopeptide repeat protein [Planctomycetota bacterium]|nr:tetratricopeptide repeat protein [Planctomycetota bacterium]
MKRTLAIMLLCLATFSATAGESGERERNFVRGLELFDKAKSPDDYRAAAALFESLLDANYVNGAVLYNIGNSYMRAGDYGKAILAYRKAKPFRPRDPYLDANLRQALMVAPGRLPPPATPWWRHVFFWTDSVSYPEKVFGTVAGFVFGALIAAAALLLRKKKLYLVSGVFVSLAGVLAIDAAVSHSDVRNSRLAVVTRETIARKGIGAQYEPAFDQPLKDGAEFTVIDRNGEWIFGHFEGIGDGWLRRDAVAE